MTRRLVPLTPAVVEWAITQSGFSLDEVAEAIPNASPSDVRNWIDERGQPSLTQARALAKKVKRSLAALLLPRPPQTVMPNVEFRHPPGASRRTLNPVERYQLREAARIQRAASWALRAIEQEGRVLPQRSLDDEPELVANWVRAELGIDPDDQRGWRSASEALSKWRAALEDWGLLVFLVSMGKDSCRGFSIWDDVAPVIAANTWWNVEARAFTLLHELGHLVTRTSSACLEPSAMRTRRATDKAERWCEEFAAAVLLPWEAVTACLAEFGWTRGDDVDLRLVKRLAKRFRVSVRATALRLIKRKLVTWSVYREIAPVADLKRPGGGGEGRNRAEARLDEMGSRTSRVFLEALNRNVLDASDVLDYMRLPDRDLDTLAQTLAG